MNQYTFLNMRMSKFASHAGLVESDELFDQAVRAVRYNIHKVSDSEQYAPNKYLVEFDEHGCYFSIDPDGRFIPLPFQFGHDFVKDKAVQLASMINQIAGSDVARVVKVEEAYRSALNELTLFSELGLQGFREYENGCTADEMIGYATILASLQSQSVEVSGTGRVNKTSGCLVWLVLLPGVFVGLAVLFN